MIAWEISAALVVEESPTWFKISLSLAKKLMPFPLPFTDPVVL